MASAFYGWRSAGPEGRFPLASLLQLCDCWQGTENRLTRHCCYEEDALPSSVDDFQSQHSTIEVNSHGKQRNWTFRRGLFHRRNRGYFSMWLHIECERKRSRPVDGRKLYCRFGFCTVWNHELFLLPYLRNGIFVIDLKSDRIFGKNFYFYNFTLNHFLKTCVYEYCSLSVSLLKWP